MKLEIFLVLLACCLYLATARPNEIDSDVSEEKSQPKTAENSENEEFDVNIRSQSESEYTSNDAMERIGKKPLHKLADLLYNDYNVSKSTLIESLEQIENLEITMLKKSTEMYKQIFDYVNNTQLPNNYQIPYEVEEIFKVYRHEEQIRYEPYERNFNRQLLFHGTSHRNLVSILKNGLKISPPEASFRSGSSFGRGIYFSDSLTLSTAYCRSNNKFTLVLLCEVALGKISIRNRSDNNEFIDHCESVQALGRYYPHSLHIQPDGLKIPNGVLFKRNETTDTGFNTFVVPDGARVKIRYIVKLKSS